MNTITIEINGETLTIPDDAIDAVTAELTERFGKRDELICECGHHRDSHYDRKYWCEGSMPMACDCDCRKYRSATA